MKMARLKAITIRGYRSIRDQITIRFPPNVPVVLIGENNVGKSNIISAMDLILGETWPGNYEPDDHEFWDRKPSNGPIEIRTEFEPFSIPDGRGSAINVRGFRWVYDPSSSGEKCIFHAETSSGERYVVNEMRDRCTCIVVGADRRLSYQLSYASKWTLLSKLMRKFHRYLTSDPERVKQLKEKFKEIKQIFTKVQEFAEFQSGLTERFSNMVSGMTYRLEIDFSAYDPSNFFHSLRVFPHENGRTRTFEELGSGEEQLLALAFAHAYAKAFYEGIILAIEEPEAHLHPLAQQWLAKEIHQMARDRLQIVITTHSPAFVNILGLEGIVLVRKLNGATVVKQLTAQELADYCIEHGAHPDRTNAQTILPFYAASATQEILSGLFAKKVILVEGPTEAIALPIYLSRVGLNVTKRGIAVIPVMGKGNLAKWWRFFTAYEIPTFLIFDNDVKDDRDGKKRKDALRTIGVREDEIGQIIAVDDWNIGSLYCVFGKDFEETLRRSFSGYGWLESRAKDEIGDSKPLVARYVAERLPKNNDIGWTKFKELKEKIERLANSYFNP